MRLLVERHNQPERERMMKTAFDDYLDLGVGLLEHRRKGR